MKKIKYYFFNILFYLVHHNRIRYRDNYFILNITTKHNFITILFFCIVFSISTRVLKPGPARRADPGPDRPGPGTGPGGGKNPLGNWPGETRSTRRVDPGPGPPGQTRVRPGWFIYHRSFSSFFHQFFKISCYPWSFIQPSFFINSPLVVQLQW